MGNWNHAKALILIALLGVILIGIGNAFARFLLPENSRGWGVSLALGILCTSLVASFFAWAHILKWWLIAPFLFLSILMESRRRTVAMFAEAWRNFSSRWNTAVALALQGIFLLTVFVYVYAVAPETQSDALRSYLPYLKLMRNNSGFVDVPYQWAYIIPQAGLTYAGTVMILFRERVLQLSTLLVWLALIGIVCRRKAEAPLEVKTAVALLVASCPVVLWVVPNLMQDCFACLAVVMLAVLCLEGRDPGSARFWTAVGVGAGLAWAAKFSTLAYAIPLLIGASIRSHKAKGWARTAPAMVLACFSGLLTLAPWFANSYRQSGNAIFPFLLKVFPAPLWPRGVGFSNLDNFRLPPGPRGWFLWLTDLTYNTSRFVEGPDGKLGMTLLILFLFAILAFWKGTPLARAMVASAFIGTALLISMTAYLRYWMSGLWLVAAVVPPTVAGIARFPRSRVVLSAAAAAILACQAFMMALGHWADPRGWPWSYYTGKTSWQSLMSGNGRGVEMLSRLQKSWGRQWPRVWYTDFEPIGHFNVVPMEAAIWELSLHCLEPRAKIQYLSSAGCDYWIVDEESQNAEWFKIAGISPFFWDDRLLVASDAPIRVYRMRPAAEVLRAFDERALPGSDLLMNGGFEAGQSGKSKFWRTDGDAHWLMQASEAHEGEGCFRLGPGGSLHQEIPLPPGIKTIELDMAARGARADKTIRLRWDLGFKGFGKDPSQIRPDEWPNAEHELANVAAEVKAERCWKHNQGRAAVPAFARSATLFVENPDSGGEAFVDALHLYIR